MPRVETQRDTSLSLRWRPPTILHWAVAAGLTLAARPCTAGLLFLASYQAGDNPAAMRDPRIQGALLTYYWSQIETKDGVYDWSQIDRRLALWKAAGKKVAVRLVWSADGNWPHPHAKHPTPQWVIDKGAATITAPRSQTQIPLAWDPIYLRYQRRFVQRLAAKYDGAPTVLFVDLTPGGETNPYRFSLNATEPGLKQAFSQAAASDGSRYSDARWLETVQGDIDVATAAFRRTPVLVTLNVTHFQRIGDYAVSKGCYTGQNGLNGQSYLDPTGPWLRAFTKWGGQTKLYFEMFGPAGPKNGTLPAHIEAAQRGGASYVGIYAADVLKGIPGQRNYQQSHADALTEGAKRIGDVLATKPVRRK